MVRTSNPRKLLPLLPPEDIVASGEAPGPLLVEERPLRSPAPFQDVQRPLLLHRPPAGPGLAADDGPADATQVEVRQRAEERLQREEPDTGRHPPQFVHPPQVLVRLHA